MQRIKKLVSTQNKEEGVLYTYLIDDDSGEPYKVSTIDRKFEVGERVAVIWTKSSDQYGKPYLKRICAKCNKQYAEKDAIRHEYCQYPDR